MSKVPKKNLPAKRISGQIASEPLTSDFEEVVTLIHFSRSRAMAAVNHELLELYWQIGEYISRKLASAA